MKPGGHFMKLVITDSLSFTDYYHGNSQWQCFIANQNVTVLVSEWQIVSDDKFHEMPPRKGAFRYLIGIWFSNHLNQAYELHGLDCHLNINPLTFQLSLTRPVFTRLTYQGCYSYWYMYHISFCIIKYGNSTFNASIVNKNLPKLCNYFFFFYSRWVL